MQNKHHQVFAQLMAATEARQLLPDGWLARIIIGAAN